MYSSIDHRQKQRHSSECTNPFLAWTLVDKRGLQFHGPTKIYTRQNGRKYHVNVYGRPVFKRLINRPCANQRCPCNVCRQAWARNEAAILEKSFETLSPSHFVVLESNLLTAETLWPIFNRFIRLVKDYVRKKCKVEFEYTMYVEQTPNHPPHIHLLVRTDASVTKDLIQPLWFKACNEHHADDELALSILSEQNDELPHRHAIYFKPIRNVKTAAKYVTKFWSHRDASTGRLKLYRPWLPGIEWTRKKTKSTSRKFLSHPDKVLWEMVKADWFPDGGIDYDQYETWDEPRKFDVDKAGQLDAYLDTIDTDELALSILREHDDELSLEDQACNIVRSFEEQLQVYGFNPDPYPTNRLAPR